MRPVHIIGVPLDLGQTRRGVDMGCSAVRVAGLEARPRLNAASRLTHTDVVVKMDAKPSQALRKGRWRSSMFMKSVLPPVLSW